MNKLVENIWKKYHKTKLPKSVETSVLHKANASYKKAKGKYKLNTFISWWARQAASKER